VVPQKTPDCSTSPASGVLPSLAGLKEYRCSNFQYVSPAAWARVQDAANAMRVMLRFMWGF
jgi:hypothetical protein